MSRLYRPHIPLAVRCRVAERQLMQSIVIMSFASIPDRPAGARLAALLEALAERKGCDVSELRLDHDPPLAARPVSKWAASGKPRYIPEANCPDHLFYRPHGAQHAGSHDVKTRIRGDHGQFSDIALIKRQRRRDRASDPASKPRRPKQKLQSRGFGNVSRPFPKRTKR